MRSDDKIKNCSGVVRCARAPGGGWSRVNQELADTNRGVVALYAELDERASHLEARRRASNALSLGHEP